MKQSDICPDFYALLSADSLRATADIAIEAVGNRADFFAEVLKIALTEKPPINWRAARVLYICAEKNSELLAPHADNLAEALPTFTNDGMKRGIALALSYVVMQLSDDKILMLVKTGFEWMLSEEKIAVKYNVAKLLFEISKRVPDLKGELQAVIEFCISTGEFRNNGDIAKILKKIH